MAVAIVGAIVFNQSILTPNYSILVDTQFA